MLNDVIIASCSLLSGLNEMPVILANRGQVVDRRGMFLFLQNIGGFQQFLYSEMPKEKRV